MNIRSISMAVAAVALAAALSGCGTKGTGGTETSAAGPGGNAEALYKKSCISCHGDQLQGRIGPGTDLTKVGGKKSRDEIVTQIAKGGNGMPGFSSSLSETDIGTLADWLAAKK